jgi:hypothetical protein
MRTIPKQIDDVVGIDFIIGARGRRTGAVAATIDQHHLVSIGEVTLVWKRIQTPTHAAVHEERMDASSKGIDVERRHTHHDLTLKVAEGRVCGWREAAPRAESLGIHRQP